jgi:ribosomal protein L11 methyltransferase
MSWLQIAVEADSQTAEHISDSLFALGALSVTLQDAADQPVYEPPLTETPLWEQTRVIGLFSAEDVEPATLQTQLQTLLAPLTLPPCHFHWLADQAWTRVCMRDFQPMHFGERLWVCPSWQPPPDPQAINIFLDPGLAFGTGTHTTTALCLEWLAQQQDNLQGKTFIDYGCGSGILALAAIKLGATQVWAVDHDSQALIATQENAKKNGIEQYIHIVAPEQLPTIEVDGIMANILATPLCQLAETFANHLMPNAPVILSGILQAQLTMIKASFTPYFSVTETATREGWLRIVAHKL